MTNPLPPFPYLHCPDEPRTVFNNPKGFTLMEVLVATAITGIALGVLLSSFALGHRQAFRGDMARKAAIAAETVLAMYENDPDGFPDSDSGDVPGMEQWTYSIESKELYLRIDAGEAHSNSQEEEEEDGTGIEVPELLEVSLKIIPPEKAQPFVLTLWVNSGVQ